MKLRTASLPLAIRTNGEYSITIRLKESDSRIAELFGVELSEYEWSRVGANVRENLRFRHFANGLWKHIATKEVKNLSSGEVHTVAELGLTQQSFASWFADSVRIPVDANGVRIPGVLLSFSDPKYLGESEESEDLSDILG